MTMPDYQLGMYGISLQWQETCKDITFYKNESTHGPIFVSGRKQERPRSHVSPEVINFYNTQVAKKSSP